MLTRKLTPMRKAKGLLKLGMTTLARRPRLVNLEVTKFCNAKCDFCDYWKTKESPQLDDYVDVVKRIRPLMVSITGGEPLLRKDLPQIIRRIHESMFFIYIGMVTHGQLLSVQKANELWEAGLDQLSISMNWMGAAHDKERGIPGLFDHRSKSNPNEKGAKPGAYSLNVLRSMTWGLGIRFQIRTSVRVSAPVHVSVRSSRVPGTLRGIRTNTWYTPASPATACTLCSAASPAFRDRPSGSRQALPE